MANNISSKLPISKNIIYDSRNDTSTGRKRAVQTDVGVSVAERARLFGTQVKLSSIPKNPNSQELPKKTNIVHQDRNYQSFKTDVDRYSKQNRSSSPPKRVSNNYRPPPVQINDRPKREQASSIDSRHYPTVTRPQKQHSSTHQRQVPIYDTYQYNNQITPGESYRSNDDPYFDSYNRQKSSSSSSLRNTNYFQPIQDPLEALYKSSTQGYFEQQIPVSTDTSNMQPFDLGNLINRIQEDYLNNVRPYVSSIQFIQNEQNLADIGFITPSTSRKNYTKRPDDIYLQQGLSYQYDIIDPNNGLYPIYSKEFYNNNNYSSIKRRKHRRRYHDQASSPIHVFESSNITNKQYQPESPPDTPTPKASTPVATSSNEEEEEEETTINTQAEATGSESEDESSETPSQPPNTITPAPITTGTPATKRNEQPNPTLPKQTPEKSSESETSESEESDSESDSDTEDEKPKPSPIIRSNNPRPTPTTTPQINTRVIPQRTTTTTTPQINTRVVLQRTTADNDSRNQPGDQSYDPTDSVDLPNSKKSSVITSKLKSIKNKFRRK